MTQLWWNWMGKLNIDKIKIKIKFLWSTLTTRCSIRLAIGQLINRQPPSRFTKENLHTAKLKMNQSLFLFVFFLLFKYFYSLQVPLPTFSLLKKASECNFLTILVSQQTCSSPKDSNEKCDCDSHDTTGR